MTTPSSSDEERPTRDLCARQSRPSGVRSEASLTTTCVTRPQRFLQPWTSLATRCSRIADPICTKGALICCARPTPTFHAGGASGARQQRRTRPPKGHGIVGLSSPPPAAFRSDVLVLAGPSGEALRPAPGSDPIRRVMLSAREGADRHDAATVTQSLPKAFRGRPPLSFAETLRMTASCRRRCWIRAAGTGLRRPEALSCFRRSAIKGQRRSA